MAKSEFQKVNVPVENHGLHEHKFNFPYLGTSRFMEVLPVFYEPLQIKEKSNPKFGLFSLLEPLTQNAFVTGRIHYKGVFVPYTFVFRPWYHFQRGIEYYDHQGNAKKISQAPNCTHGLLSSRFVTLSNGLVTLVANPAANPPYNFDIKMSNNSCYKLTLKGRRVLKVLNGLGISPSWIVNDSEPVLLINVLCYIKAFCDCYFPGQYVGSSVYNSIIGAIQPENFSYGNNSAVDSILAALANCSVLFYDKSIFDYCWDTPSGPSNNSPTSVTIVDQTYGAIPSWDSSNATIITNNISEDPAHTVPNNGAFIGNPNVQTGVDTFMGRITKFGLQALESIANFMRRNQLVGSRLIDNFLAARGVQLGNIEGQNCFVIGDKYVDIQVSAVENNSNTNLGELAGKGYASTNADEPFSFECSAEHDGVFIIFQSVEPDCDMPVYNDQYNSRIFMNDFYHGAFDKLGVEGVRQISAFCSMNGVTNVYCQDKLFGFMNRYFGDVQEKPRLVGDFRFNTQGAAELSKYHTFRTFSFDTVLGSDGLYHSLNFIDGQNDYEQYQRLFYANEPDCLKVYIRFFGNNQKFKLPIGDSFDWSDDEFNKKVQLLNQGMKG